MSNHYGHNVDITATPFFCSDHNVYLSDSGAEIDTDSCIIRYACDCQEPNIVEDEHDVVFCLYCGGIPKEY